jgi:hypothetical protein
MFLATTEAFLPMIRETLATMSPRVIALVAIIAAGMSLARRMGFAPPKD